MRLGISNNILFSLFCLVFLLGCAPRHEESIRLITVQAEEKTSLLSYKSPEAAFGADLGGSVTFPVENGDFIWGNDDLILIPGKEFPDTISLRSRDFLSYLNGELYEIRIDTIKKILPWLQQMHREEILQLKVLLFSKPLPDSLKPYLQQMAQWNSHLDIMLNYDSAEAVDRDLGWLSQFFKPRALMIGTAPERMANLSAVNFPELEFLILGISKSDFGGSLPPLPSMKALFIGTHDIGLTPDFFNQNLQLEKLTVLVEQAAIPSTAPWSKLIHLKELNFSVDHMVPYDMARQHPDLRTLIVQKNFDVDSIQGLKKLKWLYLPAPPNQQDFDKIGTSLSSLELLSLFNTDSSQSFHSLNKFSQLKYLIIANKMGVDSTLYGFKGLKYLSVPEDYLEDSTRANALKRALPSTIIAPNSGLCMGTGWLLLLLPLAAGLFLLQRPVRNALRNNVS